MAIFHTGFPGNGDLVIQSWTEKKDYLISLIIILLSFSRTGMTGSLPEMPLKLSRGFPILQKIMK